MPKSIRLTLEFAEALELAEALDSAVSAIEAERNDCALNGDSEGCEVRETERKSLAAFLKMIDRQIEGMDHETA